MPASAPTAAKTIVVADDTAFVRDRFTAALRSAGHQTTAVGDSAALLARIREEPAGIDLVVLDLRLPPLQGLGLIHALRAVDGFTAPIVVFSGTIASADEVRDLSLAGVAGYVNEYSAVQHIVPALAPHLSPEENNRRTGPRVVVGMSVSYRVGNTIAAAFTLNISRGGLAIRTTSPLPPATPVKVRFRLPNGARDVDAEATVAWADRRAGMGLRFTRIDPAAQAAIDDFVRTHFFSNRKA
ncbi:MAG: TIGR02266 family protein [Acidobacteria bacterium]|nr:TIGR02266 family protein [Acidobacteriota bacterium]